MKVEFDTWEEKDWYPAGPTGSKTEDFPGYKKKYGGFGFTEAGRIYISKRARWKKALYWHERGHCLQFEAGRVKTLKPASLEEEIRADAVADIMAGTYQTLGMLTMILRRSKGRNISDTRRRIDAVCRRHPNEAQKILNKLTRRKTPCLS